MKKVYVTLTGTNHYYGTSCLEKEMKVHLEKDPENRIDKEAIKVKLPGLGKIGYIANSVYTVAEDCMSAGRLYDKIKEEAIGKVLYIFGNSAILEVETIGNI